MAINIKIGLTDRIRSFSRREISPQMTKLYSRFGFANRYRLAMNLSLLGSKHGNHDLLLDQLAQKGILKARFRESVSSLSDINDFMLSGSITGAQASAASRDINQVIAMQTAGAKNLNPLDIINGLSEALGTTGLWSAGSPTAAGSPQAIFSSSIVDVAASLDRIFPGAEGTHSKLAHAIATPLGLFALREQSGAARLGFVTAISLGIVATVASPFLLPALGSAICTLGFEYALGLKLIGGAMTATGLLARYGARKAHEMGPDGQDTWLAKMGRSKSLQYLSPFGMATLYTGFTFGTSVSNTFVLGNFLLENGALLGGITAGIPLVALLGSMIYYYVGTHAAMRATEGTPPPYGQDSIRVTDIKKTYAYSGSAVVFSTMYFMYRWVATSIFVTAAFAPISALSVGITMGMTLGGFALGFGGSMGLPAWLEKHGLLSPESTRKFRSPFPGFLTGTLGSVALPMATGAILGDYGSIAHSISALISLGVFASDIHSTSHGVMFHQGQIASIYPDRLAPSVSYDVKKAYAGYFGRQGKKPITSFWEKAFVTTSDIIFSTVTSAFFEPNAYLKQCVLQCDQVNRGVGKGAKQALGSIKIVEDSQAELNKVYAKCQAALTAFRGNQDLTANYHEVVRLLNYLGRYFTLELPSFIKQQCDQNGEKWKGIYDASLDISMKKGLEFIIWAKELEERLATNDQLSREEVGNILTYLCDRFDKEFIISIRKDSNEFTMRVQKNENQAGVREFIGSTGVEVLCFNEGTKQASIERIVATHIRRQKADWLHVGEGREGKYEWIHRSDERLETDAEAVKEYRSKVRSHSKDLDFVINDANGRPLALQTKSGEIVLLTAAHDGQILLLADGSKVIISMNDNKLTALDEQDRVYVINNIEQYNARHDNKIYLVADSQNAHAPIKLSELPGEIADYYKKRPLYTYAIDPHDYEFNLDSEFVNGRIAFEYVPLFEADRQKKHVALTYRFERQVELDYSLSGTPLARRPDRVQINWSPMYLKVTTKDGNTYVIPYLEEKNGQIEPTVIVEKANITDWQVLLKKYAPIFSKGAHNKDNGLFEAVFNHEYMTEEGINEITLAIPSEMFGKNAKGEYNSPNSPAQFIELLTRYRDSHRSETDKLPELSLKHKRKYNWRRIIGITINEGQDKLLLKYDTENRTVIETELPRHHSNAPRYSIHMPPLEDIADISIEPFKQSVGTLPYARYTYHFATLEEAEKEGFAEVQRNDNGTETLDQNHQPVMKKGCPIWRVYDQVGNVTGYEIERFGRPESIYELGAIDPNSVKPGSFRVDEKRKKLVFTALEWGRKMFPIEAGLVDLGTEENPKGKITGIIADKKALRELFGRGSIVWGGGRHLANLGKSLDQPYNIVDIKAVEQGEKVRLEIVRKQKYADLAVTSKSLQEMWRTPEWVDRIEFGGQTAEGQQIIIRYKDPHTGRPIEETQTVVIDDARLADLNIFHLPEAKIEQREIYDSFGNLTLTPYLKLIRVGRETMEIVTKDAAERAALLSEKLSILTPKSAVTIVMNNGQTINLPLNDEIDGAKYVFAKSNPLVPEEELALFPHEAPKFEDGKVGLIIGPQLSISGRNWFDFAGSGHPYCALDQSIFMAYDLSAGYSYGRQPYAPGINGGGIQTHKSRAGDGRIRETATVQNGTPVGRPLRKTLASGDSWNETEFREPFFSFAPMPATITEDYREGKGIYKKHGHATVFFNKVVAIGAGVPEFPNQIVTQRRRWPSSVPIGQYWFFRDLWDEFIGAKIKGDKPSFYTWDQLLHEWNGVTWYYCGMAEYARSFAPLAYFAGLTAYPVDSVAFPLLWGGMFGSSMASHIYSMKKVGNHPMESVFWGQAAYKTLVPNYIEMILPQPGLPETQGTRAFEELFTPRLGKECLGQFGVTAMMGGGKMPDRYSMQIDYNIILKSTAVLRGLLAMGDTANLSNLQGSFGPDAMSSLTTYFAIVMNTIWPYYDTALNVGAKQLADNDRDKNTALLDRRRFRLIAQMLRTDIKGSKPSFTFMNAMRNTLGITDIPKGLENRARYIQDLSSEECREIFLNMPDEAASMMREMIGQELITVQKMAAIIESMLETNDLHKGLAIRLLTELPPITRKAILENISANKKIKLTNAFDQTTGEILNVNN